MNVTLRNVNYITRDTTVEAHMNKHSQNSQSNSTVGGVVNSAVNGIVSLFSNATDQATVKQYCQVYDLSFLQQYSVNDKVRL